MIAPGWTRARFVGIVCALSGCALSEDHFPQKFAELNCARHWQCDRGSYDLLYSGYPDCVREYNETFTELAAFETEYGCTYDPDEAEAAYGELSGMTCAEWHSGNLLLGFTSIWASCDE